MIMQTVTSVAAPSWRSTVGAYVNLIKPHVTVLLLGTTLASMVVAEGGGFPPLGLVLATLLGGAMAAGSANAINCYWDRDIDQLMTRTRKRSIPAQRVRDMQALVFGIGLGVLSFVVLAGFVNPLAALLVGLGDSLLCRRVYDVAQADHASKYRHRRRGGGGAGAGWLGRGYRNGLAGRHLDVPYHFPVDAAAFLGALAGAEEGLRAGWCAYAAGSGRRERDLPADYPLYAALAGGLAGPVLHRRDGLPVSGRSGAARRRATGAGHSAGPWKTLEHARRMFWFSNYYLALIFALMVLDRVLR